MTFSSASDNFSFLRSTVLSAAILSVAVLVITGCALGDSGSDSNDVVFAVEIDSNADLFKIDSETGDLIRLTTSVAVDLMPVWSPNKKQIAFISDTNGASALWLMDAGGQSKRQISGLNSDISNFRWAPDSVRIAIENNRVGNGTISILDTETDELTPLTTGAENARVGDWSPDGEWVVYEVAEGPDSAIRRRNPNGVDEITIASGRSANSRWSRNGQWIAFDRVNEDGSFDLVVIDKDGENESIVAVGVNPADPHDWSPDSKQLVYLSGAYGEAEIYVTGRDGNGMKQLTSNRVLDSAPKWSPDGSSILFLSDGDGSLDVYTMNKDGSQQTRVTSEDELVLFADW